MTATDKLINIFTFSIAASIVADTREIRKSSSAYFFQNVVDFKNTSLRITKTSNEELTLSRSVQQGMAAKIS